MKNINYGLQLFNESDMSY